jgi:hypothetical protein
VRLKSEQKLSSPLKNQDAKESSELRELVRTLQDEVDRLQKALESTKSAAISVDVAAEKPAPTVAFERWETEKKLSTRIELLKKKLAVLGFFSLLFECNWIFMM